MKMPSVPIRKEATLVNAEKDSLAMEKSVVVSDTLSYQSMSVKM